MATAKSSKDKIIELLGKYKLYYRYKHAIPFHTKQGLHPQALFDFIMLSGLSASLIDEVFAKDMKTFQEYLAGNKLLDAITSEKLIMLFALYGSGAEVFGSMEAFTKWLTKPAYGLGDVVPQVMFHTITGIALVQEELTRISYGDLA